jgi:FkbM family methyltransferase
MSQTSGTAGSASQVRRILGSVDRQDYPSPFVVRLGSDDVDVVEDLGIRVAIDKADISVSTSVGGPQGYEPHVASALRSLLRDGQHFVDVGANIGVHALHAAELVGPTGRVTAFEPNSENCRLLLHSIQLNKFTNVSVFPFALSERRGWSYFSTHIGTNGGFVSGEHNVIDGWGMVVPTFSLDELLIGGVNVMKVDVEGAEWLVVAGGRQTITESRPAVISEFSCEMIPRVSGCTPRDYLDFFAALNYDFAIIDRDSHQFVSFNSPEALLRDWGNNLGRIEDLLFMPR